jgi:hypothetical protein
MIGMSKVHHMVVLKFKTGTGQEVAGKLFAALRKLQERLPGILYFAGGPYASPEGLHRGFTHGFLMTFRDAAARDHYLDHPEHEKVKNDFLPVIEDLVVFDFAE